MINLNLKMKMFMIKMVTSLVFKINDKDIYIKIGFNKIEYNNSILNSYNSV